MVFVRVLISDLGFFFFKKKTACELRISDWSSDVCSSDLVAAAPACRAAARRGPLAAPQGARRRRCRSAKWPGRYRFPWRVWCVPGNIGRATWKDRVCTYLLIAVVAVS